MITILAILWGSAALGYLLRHCRMAWIGPLLTVSVWILLLVIGMEVGANRMLRSGLPRFGLQALACTLSCTLCCCAAAALLWRLTRPAGSACRGKTTGGGINRPGRDLWRQMKGSLAIVAFFAAGTLLGAAETLPTLPPEASLYTLYFLLSCVGLNIGRAPGIIGRIRHMDRRLAMLPLITAAGTWAGALATAALLPAYSAGEWLAVGSGFGYYSLSSVLITELRGAELGTVALAYNIMRELVVLLGAPLLARLFGPLTPISIAGATSGDTTLPSITEASGTEFVPLAIFHGLTIDLSVPLLVPFFCSL